jgi:hypothetical protein
VLERLGVDLCERQVAERGPDVLLDLADVAGPCGEVELDDLQPPVDQHAQRRLGPRLPALVDLAQQLDPHALRLAARRGGLLQGVPAVGQRVHAPVHTHPEAAARELINGAASPSLPLRHDPSPASR